DDLAENAIYFPGDQDGQFDSQDFILFYAEGTDNWNEESETHLNLYSDRSYYYVTTTGGNGKRITDMPQPSSGNTTITTFEDYQFHEKDLINIVRTGRRWFGEPFNIDAEQEFNFRFPGVVPSEPISIQVKAAAAAYVVTSMQVEANGQAVGTLNFTNIVENQDVQATSSSALGTITGTENVTVKLTYNNNGVPGSRAYLDYIAVKAIRSLRGYGSQYRFTNNSSSTSGTATYQFSNASEITHVWDITDIYNVTKTTNDTGATFSFNAILGDERKYIVVDDTDFLTPLKESKSKVTNQNLKGTIFKNQQGSFQDIDYLIITPAFLNAQAERLANFHRNYSSLNVKVVNLELIYPEFSSGQQDVAAIRNFVKYVYSNASSPSKKVKYLN